MQKLNTEDEVKELELRLQESLIADLKTFFVHSKLERGNLHELLGISKTKLTHLKKNPRKIGTLILAKEIAERTGIRASVLINTIGFGKENITILQMENLIFEETFMESKSE